MSEDDDDAAKKWEGGRKKTDDRASVLTPYITKNISVGIWVEPA
jgi:hypothetical protein